MSKSTPPVTGYSSKYGYWVLTPVNAVLATEWLTASKEVRNRNVSHSRVLAYAEQMLTGRWKVTHQGIAFDENNHLTDGQHRLNAIIEAAKRNQSITIEMWVYYGLPQADMIAVDKHRPRSEQNSLYISGLDVTRHDVVTARAMRGFGSPGGIVAIGNRMSGEELATYIAMHREAITFTNHLLQRNYKGVSSGPIRALIGRAWYTQDRERLTQFISVLYSGMVEDPKADEGAIRLRNWMQDIPMTVRNATVVYKRATSALKAFLERRSLAALRETADEQFPIPGE